MAEEGSSSGDDADDSEDVSTQIITPLNIDCISLLRATISVPCSADVLRET